MSVLDHDSSKLLSAMNNQFSSMSEEGDLQNANVSAMSDQISSITEERDMLQADLTEMTKELERLQSLFNQSESLSELLCVFVKGFTERSCFL